MENSLMITILSNVVNQAPKVNQETVDNVKAIIAHLEDDITIVEAPVASVFDDDKEAVRGDKWSDDEIGMISTKKPLEFNRIPKKRGPKKKK